MSDNWKDRIKSDRDRDRQQIDDWMAGSGGKVFAVILIALVVYFVVRFFL